jgi:hypothetical protein
VPKSTQYYQNKRKQEDETQPNKKRYERKKTFNTCGHCKLPKTKDFGHSRHIGQNGVDTFCPSVEGKQFVNKEAWLAARKVANPPKNKQNKE